MCIRDSVHAVAEAAELYEAHSALANCTVAIFLLSDSFFSDARSLELLQAAVAASKTCILVVLPGAKW
eukprot:1037486-Prymnesium_polylepis.1